MEARIQSTDGIHPQRKYGRGSLFVTPMASGVADSAYNLSAWPVLVGWVAQVPIGRSLVSTSGVLGTVALERVLDMVPLLVLLLLTLLASFFPPDATMFGRPISYAVAGAVGVAPVALCVSASLVLSWQRTT